MKHITKIMKIERPVWSNFLKSSVNKPILHVNETIGHVNKAIQSEKFESKNEITTCRDKDRQTSGPYDIKGIENTSRISENK